MIGERTVTATETDFRIKMAHEIRTSMNAITGMIHLLLDTGLDAEQRTYANTAVRAAGRMLDRLNGMEAFAGDGVDGVELNIAPVDLCGLRLLVVDSNEAAAKITEQQMRARSMEVDIVSSGPAALDMLISAAHNLFAYDMVVVDHVIAGTAAVKLARKIRKFTEISDISLIMISSATLGEGNPAEIEAAGFQGFLSRPVGSAEIIHLISTIWSARHNGQILPFMTRQLLRQHNSRRNDFSKIEIDYNGVEVLLVEDSRFNRMVAGKILGKYGFVVTMAMTGREAVEQIRKKTFDIILMDCQMPEMDGYQATAAILDYERKNGLKHVPVIAFTANGMTGDDEKCLAAGMDDYISKPVQPENMIDIMSRWLTATLAQKARKAKIRREQQKKCLIDPDILEVLKSLTGARFIPVLESYISMMDKIIPVMEKAVRSKDVPTLRRESHSLKSSSMQIGAVFLGEMASEMEKLSLRASFDDITAKFPALREMSAQVVFYLENYVEMYQS